HERVEREHAEQHEREPADLGHPVDLVLHRRLRRRIRFGRLGQGRVAGIVGHGGAAGGSAHRGRASITTKAWAQGWSSVRVRWIYASWPSGVSSASRFAAPFSTFSVGAPEGRFTTPMSFM